MIALWAYRTTLRQPTRETLSTLLLGVEVQILVKFGIRPLCSGNPIELAQELDDLKEIRERAAIRMTEYQR